VAETIFLAGIWAAPSFLLLGMEESSNAMDTVRGATFLTALLAGAFFKLSGYGGDRSSGNDAAAPAPIKIVPVILGVPIPILMLVFGAFLVHLYLVAAVLLAYQIFKRRLWVGYERLPYPIPASPLTEYASWLSVKGLPEGFYQELADAASSRHVTIKAPVANQARYRMLKLSLRRAAPFGLTIEEGCRWQIVPGERHEHPVSTTSQVELPNNPTIPTRARGRKIVLD
jgi:hypothetical protein